MRPLALLALLLALLVPAASASAAATPAGAAKVKKCKKGANSKRCRCPKGQRLVKKGGKYRCKKKPSNGDGGTGNGGNTTPDNTNPDPGPGGETPPGDTTTPPPDTTNPEAPPKPPESQFVRNDAAFATALSNTMFRRYEQGTYGYGRYAYNFLPNGSFLYCSYYSINGSAPESNYAGTWTAGRGYTVTGRPNYTFGEVRIQGSTFDVNLVIDQENGAAYIDSGNASNVFTKGQFARFPNGAVTNCSAIP